MISPRVTNAQVTNSFINDIQRNLQGLLKLQHQISTGKRINQPSDDPIGADRSLDYQETIARTDQYTKNVDDLNSQASFADRTFGHMEDVLMRIRDLAVRGSNEAPENQANRDSIAEEIDNLINEMVNQANQQFDGRYIFSGDKTSTKPFEASNKMSFITTSVGNTFNMPAYTIDGVARQSQAITASNSVKSVKINGLDVVADLGGSYTVDVVNNRITLNGVPALTGRENIELTFDKVVSVTYNGDNAEKTIEIGDRTQIGINFAGATSNPTEKSVFGKFDPNGTSAGSVSMFQHLMDLRDNLMKYGNVQTASNNTVNNREAIFAGIADVEAMRANIDNVRADLGGRVNRLELAKNRLSEIKINTKDLLSKREDLDMAEAISQLTLQQNTYQAALGAGAKIIQTSLLDFLG